jgi:hypothetical protein
LKVGADRLEDRLGPDEPPYRSRGEAQVGRLLDRYGIPFFYEKPLVVYDRGTRRIWHPDFTLAEFARTVVEYAGMPDIPDYQAGIIHKQKAYAANGIPAVFIYPTDLRGPDWPARVVQKIQGVYRPASHLTRYRATSAAPPAGYRRSWCSSSRSYRR